VNTLQSKAGLENQKRIFVIDDDVDHLASVGEVLRAEGYLVETAPSGHEALERMAVKRPDLILLDLLMPEMDGARRALRCPGGGDLPGRKPPARPRARRLRLSLEAAAPARAPRDHRGLPFAAASVGRGMAMRSGVGLLDLDVERDLLGVRVAARLLLAHRELELSGERLLAGGVRLESDVELRG
jgi:hypothetical protein